MKFATRAVQSSIETGGTTGDVSPPIHLSSIYAYDAPGEMRAGYEYIRYGNPTRALLERCIADLENAPEECPALCFSSGMAAIDCVTRLLRPGDHLLISRDVYGGTTRLANTLLKPAGILFSEADATDAGRFLEAVQPATRMVWLETPSNPLVRLTDIAAVSAGAHSRGALVAVDSTFASPCFQNPLDLGADIVMHSATKYLGGHSDLLGGALVVRDAELRSRLNEIQMIGGAVLSPFDCWLTLRGIRTLDVRMRAHEQRATAVAGFLAAHPAIARVHYPGLEDHPQRELARRQMRGYGGMLAAELKGGREAAVAALGRTKIFTLAASLGGVESIISYPPLMSHAAMSPEERYARGITDGLVRLSIGLEHPDDLIADLDRALAGG
jgi:cystathionine beta-lyase/cystathionine gamma-synthase